MESLSLMDLAEALQERNLPLLRKVRHHLGIPRTAALLAEALAVEGAGGMLTHDGTRRRTPGGMFFQLVRQSLSAEERQQLFPFARLPDGTLSAADVEARKAREAERAQKAPQRPQAPLEPPLTWETLGPLSESLASTPAGEARTMKLTLIGRPGQTEIRQQCVIFRMQGKPPGPLPRGLPAPLPTPPLIWTVLVALRQWNRVKDSLTTHAEDQLIIEGYPTMQGTQHVLMAQSCASMAMQRAVKAGQRAAAEAEAAVPPADGAVG